VLVASDGKRADRRAGVRRESHRRSRAHGKDKKIRIFDLPGAPAIAAMVGRQDFTEIKIADVTVG
jgi:hypothetical protein